jgi:hypothetical protein
MSGRELILEHILNPGRPDLSPEFAQYVLGLRCPEADRERYLDLADRAQTAGCLSNAEVAELERFLTINDFLSLLQSKARLTLRQIQPAA